MAYLKDGKYWKVTDVEINRQMKVAKVCIKGYASKEDSDAHKVQITSRNVTLTGDLYPFINEVEDQTAQVYINLALKDTYFADAEVI